MRHKLSLTSLILVWIFVFVLAVIPSLYADGPVGKINLKVYKDASEPVVNIELSGSLGELIDIELDGIKPSDKEFAFYVYNGQKVDDSESFLVSESTNIAVFFKAEEEIIAAYVDTNGYILGVQYGIDEIELNFPGMENPTKPGLSFSGWSLTGVITEDVIVKAEYELSDNNKYTVTLDNEAGVYGAGEYDYNEIATISTDLEDFSHWVQVGSWTDGAIVSYNRELKFTVLENITLKAVTGSIEPRNIIYLNEVTGIRPGYESYVGQVNLISGYTLVEAGLVLSNIIPMPSIGDEFVDKGASTSIHSVTKEFLVSIVDDTFRYVRAYAIIRNELGEFTTIYSQNSKHSTDVTFQLWVNHTWNPRPIVEVVFDYDGANNDVLLMYLQSSPDNDYLATKRFEWFGDDIKWLIIHYKYRYNDSFNKPDGEAITSYINFAVTDQYLDFVGGH